MTDTPDILKKIVEHKRQEVIAATIVLLIPAVIAAVFVHRRAEDEWLRAGV